MAFYIPIVKEIRKGVGPKCNNNVIYYFFKGFVAGYIEGHMTLDDFSWTDPLRYLILKFTILSMSFELYVDIILS